MPSRNRHTCGPCGYSTASKRDYAKHLVTQKHRALGTDYPQAADIEREHACAGCGRAYKHRGSLYNHQRACAVKSESQWLREQVGELQALLKLVIPNVGDRVIRDNQIAVNVFLNERCAGAQPFGAFVERIQVSLDELLATNRLGFSRGISDILVDRLEKLEVTERPFHCVDPVEPRFYVKEGAGWEQDRGEKVTTAIGSIARKQVASIKEWEAEHPGWHEDPQQTEMYMSMVRTVTAGSNDSEIAGNQREAMKHVASASALRLTPPETAVEAANASGSISKGSRTRGGELR
jgi:hypothetical protein